MQTTSKCRAAKGNVDHIDVAPNAAELVQLVSHIAPIEPIDDTLEESQDGPADRRAAYISGGAKPGERFSMEDCELKNYSSTPWRKIFGGF